jgi:Ca-activated chloride channel family protein
MKKGENTMKRTMIRKGILAFSIILIMIGSLAAHAETFPEVMFILDASGSMWGKVGDKTKIEVAKEVMASAVTALPKEVRVGLTAYGHRKKGDCTDVEILIPAGSNDRQGLLKKVMSLSPKGKTPIAASIKMVAENLKNKENETTIILVSDGIETCHDDPCGVVKALKQSGIKFIIHVVGFGVDTKATEQLKCIASAGGGRYFGVADASALASAFEAVKEDVTVKVEKAKTTKVKATHQKGIALCQRHPSPALRQI